MGLIDVYVAAATSWGSLAANALDRLPALDLLSRNFFPASRGESALHPKLLNSFSM
jgi:hypothetical protein